MQIIISEVICLLSFKAAIPFVSVPQELLNHLCSSELVGHIPNKIVKFSGVF